MEETNPVQLENEITYMTPEEIRAEYDKNNMDVINGVLQGNIKAKKEEESVVSDKPAEETPVENAEIVNTEDNSIDVAAVLKEKEEERLRLREHLDNIEREKAEKEQLVIAEREALLKQIEEERRKREEYEERIREYESRKESATVETPVDDDLVSDYSKQTRKMVEEIRGQISQLSINDPRLNTLNEKIRKIEETEQIRMEELKKEEAIRKEKEKEQKTIAEIKSLQEQYSELQTNGDIKTIANDFTSFKNKLVKFANAQTPIDQDRILMTYFDPEKGAQLREQASNANINPPSEAEKFVKIAELLDMMKGLEYDPVLERFVEIKNSYGEPVKYRSLEEAYRIKHHYDEINNAKRKIAKQYVAKLEQIQSSPVRIENSATKPMQGGLTREQISQIIRDADAYVYDIDKYKLVQRAYNAIGQEPPAYRGKR